MVALLVSHRASTDLLWSGHSPLSLAIAAGNDLVNTPSHPPIHRHTRPPIGHDLFIFLGQAVEELLNGGADPNTPLGLRVGSALCVLANINYHLGGSRAKLVDTQAHSLSAHTVSLCSSWLLTKQHLSGISNISKMKVTVLTMFIFDKHGRLKQGIFSWLQSSASRLDATNGPSILKPA